MVLIVHSASALLATVVSEYGDLVLLVMTRTGMSVVESDVVSKWFRMCRAMLGLFGAWFALVPILYSVSF